MSKDKKLDEMAGVFSIGVSGSIIASGVAAAQQANADVAWMDAWAIKSLRPILKDVYLDASRQARQEEKETENTWSNKIKKAFWFVVGVIVTAIVAYCLTLAGFKV